MNKTKIMYTAILNGKKENIPVWFRLLRNKPTSPMSYWTCPICNTSVSTEKEFYTVNNNFQLFPGCVCHKSCIDNFEATGGVGRRYKDIVRLLYVDYRSAKKYKEKYGHWFREE